MSWQPTPLVRASRRSVSCRVTPCCEVKFMPKSTCPRRVQTHEWPPLSAGYALAERTVDELLGPVVLLLFRLAISAGGKQTVSHPLESASIGRKREAIDALISPLLTKYAQIGVVVGILERTQTAIFGYG